MSQQTILILLWLRAALVLMTVCCHCDVTSVSIAVMSEVILCFQNKSFAGRILLCGWARFLLLVRVGGGGVQPGRAAGRHWLRAQTVQQKADHGGPASLHWHQYRLACALYLYPKFNLLHQLVEMHFSMVVVMFAHTSFYNAKHIDRADASWILCWSWTFAVCKILLEEVLLCTTCINVLCR